MRALEELPSATKNLLIPIIRVRPWLTALEISRAIERIKEAIGDRYFGLDLDPSRRNHRDTEAYADFERLFDPAEGWRNYYDYVDQTSSAIPVLRTGLNMQLDAQLARISAIERGLFVRVQVQTPIALDPVARRCSELGIENVVFIFDCGWQDHLLPFQAACVNQIRTILAVSDEFEFVVAGGDFPASGFDQHGRHFELFGEERSLFEGVRRQINEAEIVFGDWASTREPATDNQIRRSRPRLDMATRRGWECWRSTGAEETFAELADQAATDRQLEDMSDLWGEQMIIATRDGAEPSIKSQTMAAAVRVNLHMITQAHFDQGDGPAISDELVVDEL